MKSLTSTAIVALTAGIIGLAGVVPAAFAQQQPPAGQAAPMPPDQMQNGQMQNGPGPHQGFGHFNLRQLMQQQMQMRAEPPRPGLLDLVCSDSGAERLEVAFVHLAHRVTLTPAQQPLFDDLKTTALTAQTSFADSCASARPTASANAPRDPVAGMQAMIGLEQAHLTALQTVLPKFQAFFNSLTDAQKAGLAPRRDMAGFGRRGHGMPGMPGMNQPGMEQPGPDGNAPGDMNAPAAPPPAAPPTPGSSQG